MYHGTSVPSAVQILNGGGFNLSGGPNQMLGNGLYVSKDMTKSLNYGPVVFRLLVYPGRVAIIDQQGHPLQKRWHSEYGSAWVPPNCGMVPSGLEVRSTVCLDSLTYNPELKRFQENCVKSSSQVRILGVAVGWSLLPPHIRGSVSSCLETEQLCSEEEEEILEELLLERGIKYHSIAFIGGVLSVRKKN